MPANTHYWFALCAPRYTLQGDVTVWCWDSSAGKQVMTAYDGESQRVLEQAFQQGTKVLCICSLPVSGLVLRPCMFHLNTLPNMSIRCPGPCDDAFRRTRGLCGRFGQVSADQHQDWIRALYHARGRTSDVAPTSTVGACCVYVHGCVARSRPLYLVVPQESAPFFARSHTDRQPPWHRFYL